MADDVEKQIAALMTIVNGDKGAEVSNQVVGETAKLFALSVKAFTERTDTSARLLAKWTMWLVIATGALGIAALIQAYVTYLAIPR